MTDDLADDLWARLIAVRRVVRRRLRAGLPGPALAGSQVELLAVVEANPGIGVAAAARAMRLAGNSVSALVNQLSQAGYLHRETDPTDRRAARLRLTPAAATRLGAWRTQRATLVGGALAELGDADRAAIVGALPALRRLAELLDDGASDTGPGTAGSGTTGPGTAGSGTTRPGTASADDIEEWGVTRG